MTPRQRVRAVLESRTPDRVPMDLWGSACRIHKLAYEKLAWDLGLDGYGPILRPGATTPYVDYRVSDALGCDFRHIDIGRDIAYKSRLDDDGNSIDEWGIGTKISGGFRAITHHPLAHMDEARLKAYRWPDARDPGRIAGLHDKAKRWHEEGIYAVTATSAVSGLFFELGQYLCGTETFLAGLYEEEHFIHALMDALLNQFMEFNLFYLDAIAPYIEWIEFTEDLAMQKSIFCSRAMVKKYLDAPHKALFSEIKRRHPNVKIFFHSCGAVTPIIGDILDWGVDILNPMQPLADGMDLRAIKREYGNRVLFHGGIDIQDAMRGTEADVTAEVERRIDELGDGGGYILAPSNHLMDDVPTRNIRVLYAHAAEYSARKYGKER